MLAPIVIFAFNRPDSLMRLKESLEKNRFYKDSDKFVFVDGARNEKDNLKIEKVISIAKEMTQNVIVSDVNYGLGTSIIRGVTSVISRYEKVIVLEDDLICSMNFLSYMNQALDFFKDDLRICSICGYGLKIKRPANYVGDVYLTGRSSSWGWGTWLDRWNQVDWEVKDWKEIATNKRRQKEFNKNGSDLFSMLKGYMTGKNQSWAIRFCYNQFKRKQFSIHPFLSKISNEGFGLDATNCKYHYSRFRVYFDYSNNEDFNFQVQLEQDKNIKDACYKYHSITMRIYSKIRNVFKL